MSVFRAMRMIVPCGLLSAMLLAGCSGGSDGPTRYELSGKATYQGNPIPKGRILFAPDTARGNSGPAGVADIRDGKYRTRSGSGTVGGPHVAIIYGEDGTTATEEHDNAIFPPHPMKLDLPRQDGQQDIDVPPSGRKTSPQSMTAPNAGFRPS